MLSCPAQAHLSVPMPKSASALPVAQFRTCLTSFACPSFAPLLASPTPCRWRSVMPPRRAALAGSSREFLPLSICLMISSCNFTRSRATSHMSRNSHARDHHNNSSPCPLSLLHSNSNPEDRRITPESINGRKKFKVVYVVLESQYQASMTVACKRINAAQVFLIVFHRCVRERVLWRAAGGVALNSRGTRRAGNSLKTSEETT